METTDDQQQSQGGGFSLPNIPTNIPGMPKVGDVLQKGGKKVEQVIAQGAKKLLQKAAFTPEFWIGVGIAIVILIVIALFLIIITTIVGGSNGNPLPSPEPGPPPTQGQLLTCPSGDYATCLKQDFNISVLGGTSNDIMRIFQAFAFAGQSKQYVSLLTANGPLRIFILGYDPKVCSGLTIGILGIIKISNGACFTMPIDSFRHLIIHESGHVIVGRNPRLYQSFPWTQYQTTDSSCYDHGYLKSYALRCGSSCGIRPKAESFAESVSDSLTEYDNSKFGSAQPIPDFPADCPATYNWFKDNVFGGFTFF